MKHYLVLTLISALPLYLVRFRVVGIPVNLWEVLLVCAVAITAAQALRRKELRLFFLLPREKLFRWGVGLLGAGLALSLLLNPTAHGLGIFKGWFVAVFVFFLLARHQRAQAVFYVYSASAAAVSVIALGYAFFGSLTFDGRLAAFFESPNHLAMYIAPAFLIIAGEILNPKSEIRNKIQSPKSQFLTPRIRFDNLSFGGWTLFWISCSALLIFGSALYFTKSHGAWFGVAGAFVIVWILRRVSNTVRAFVLTAVVACGIVLPFAAVWYWPHAQAALNIPDRSSAASRVTIWRSAIAIGRDYPVFGIGPGSFQAQYLRYQKNYPPYLEWAVPQPHNTYLAFWLQTGALGLVGFVLLLVWFFGALSPSLGYTRGKLRWESMRTITTGETPIPVSAEMTAVMIYILLHGAVDTLYWKNDLAVVFWMLLALAAARSHSLRQESQKL